MKTAELLKLISGEFASFHIYCHNNLSHVVEERLQYADPERNDRPYILQTLHGHYEASADTDVVVVCVLEVVEAQGSVPFPYAVPGIETGTKTLGDSANLYLPWDRCMVLSQSEMQGAASAGIYETVDAVVAIALVNLVNADPV